VNDIPDSFSESDATANGDRQILLVCRTAPYGNSLARESIETALAAGALGVKVAMLFIDEGVWQLVDRHKPESIASKNHGAILSALPLYDVEQLWVDSASIDKRGIHGENLAKLAQVINSNQVKDVLASYTTVLSF
jgi:tRNA 2-thiouridine synthesizing protein C